MWISQDISKGCRELEVFVDGELRWSGALRKGVGIASADYVTAIVLHQSEISNRLVDASKGNSSPARGILVWEDFPSSSFCFYVSLIF